MFFTVFECTVIPVSIIINVDSLPMYLIFEIFTFIVLFLTVYDKLGLSETMFHIMLPFAVIFFVATIFMTFCQLSITMTFSINPFANVRFIFFCKLTLAVYFIVLPLSFIHRVISKPAYSHTIGTIIFPLAFIFRAVWVYILPVPLFDARIPLTII